MPREHYFSSLLFLSTTQPSSCPPAILALLTVLAGLGLWSKRNRRGTVPVAGIA